jgi:hypothetical protein
VGQFDLVNAQVNAPVYAPNQRVLKKSREPRAFRRDPLHALQFRSIHQSLRVTPAMAAGVTPKPWSLTDMVRVIEDWEAARSLKISRETIVV